MTEQEQNLNDILKAFRIQAQCVSHTKVRNMSLYGLNLSPGTRIQSLQKFSEEMALALHAKSKLTFKPITETGIVQVEVMDDKPHKLDLLTELKKSSPPSDYKLPVYLGSSIDGKDIWADFSKNPHMLIAGATGAGKSVMLHTIIANLLLMSYANVLVVDTKDMEFLPFAKKFRNISIYNTYKLACDVLEYLISEMEFRYGWLRGDNYTLADFPPYVLIIDEFADLIMQDSDDKLYNLICCLTQKCRAAGIYCIVATQRPSVDVIKGVIKANLPARIAFKVSSKTDSRVILDQNGAELLVGNGDAIIKNYNNDYVRFQAAFTDAKEVFNASN
jgi:S-DNA-T family DNA segregation ATPase FtsK/SpoIIIE